MVYEMREHSATDEENKSRQSKAVGKLHFRNDTNAHTQLSRVKIPVNNIAPTHSKLILRDSAALIPSEPQLCRLYSHYV